jgi:NAD(P)-dependent dehydrogenase (short-subunit alcohol dehydrogenase family)
VVNDYGGTSSGPTAGTVAGTISKAKAVADEIVAAGGKAIANGSSVANYEQVAEMVAQTIEQFGRLDIAVVNAGIYRDRRVQKLEEADYDATFDVNVKGAFNIVRHAWPHMINQGYGRIVLTTSGAVFGGRNYWLYGSAKAAMLGMVGNLRHEGRSHNIKVNALLPGAATAMTMSDPGMTEEQRESMLREASPELVTPAAVYMCHEHCQDSGETIFAEMGRFGRVAVVKGPSLKGAATGGEGVEPKTAEWVRDHWDEIMGLEDGQKVMSAMWHEMDFPFKVSKSTPYGRIKPSERGNKSLNKQQKARL